MAIRSNVNRQIGFTPNFLMLGLEVLHPIDLMLHPGGEEERETHGTYAVHHQETMRTVHRGAGRNYSNLYDARRGIMIYVWKK